MLKRTFLPDEITLETGETLKCVIGGHLENTPFLTKEHSGVDVTQNGWGNNIFDSQEREMIVDEAKRRKLKYRKVSVLSRNLRGKRDLDGQPYRPTVYIFVEDTN